MVDTNTSIVRPGQQSNGAGVAIERAGFGTSEVQHQRETQGSALAARAQAEVQARYIVALQRPRNLDNVRVRLLMHCKRSGFALVAEYAKPVGAGKVKGPSIRFVETALQEYGNVLPDATVVYDDDYKRVIRVSVTDLERNITYNDEAVVEKFVERRNPRDGDEVLGSRTNSGGYTVYRVRSTEDDFANKCAAAVSKKTRNLGLRILPADLVDEAMFQCSDTRKDTTSQDPAAARKWIVDRFSEIGVMPPDLETFLGHPLDQTSPTEMDELRAAFATVRDGEARWVDCVDAQRSRRGELEKPSDTAKATGDKLRQKMEDAKAKRQAAQPAQGQAQPPADAKPKAAKKADAKPKDEAKTTPTANANAPKVAVEGSDPEKQPGWMEGKKDEQPAQRDGYEDRICAKCQVPIEVPKTDPPGAQCYACANA